MTMETLFNASFVLVAPFWLMMILTPHWALTRRVVGTMWIVVPAALAYTVLILPRFFDVFPLVVQPELSAIAGLLGTPEGATIGWIHYLAFDLFVGRWVYLDSRDKSFSAWLVSPILFLVLMLGPLGLISYLVLRYTAPVIRTESVREVT